MEKKTSKPESQSGHISNTAPTNKKPDMPVKTPATDTKKNTAGVVGLNQSRMVKNDPEPGMTDVGDE